MPAQMFQLLQKTGSAVCGKYTEITADAPAQIPDDLSQSPLYIGVREEWTNAGGYSGNLWIGAKGDSAAQSVALKVTYRPWTAWFWGITAIVIGAAISWYAVVYVVRQRQMAGNQILIVRLRNILDGLTTILGGVSSAGAPKPEKTLQHIQQIRDTRRRELLDQGRPHCSPVLGASLSTFPCLRRSWVVQDPDQVLAVQSSPFLRLIQQPASTLFIGSAVLLHEFFQILLARVHVHLSWVSCFAPSWVTFSFDPSESPLVTF